MDSLESPEASLLCPARQIQHLAPLFFKVFNRQRKLAGSGLLGGLVSVAPWNAGGPGAQPLGMQGDAGGRSPPALAPAGSIKVSPSSPWKHEAK